MSERVLWANLLAAIDAADLEAEESTGKLEREGWQQQAAWLRELRARRIAMGRPPDDERNAAADLCCCGPGLQRWRGLRELGYCPVHPRSELTGAEFVDAAKAALGGGLELTEELLAEMGHGPCDRGGGAS